MRGRLGSASGGANRADRVDEPGVESAPPAFLGDHAVALVGTVDPVDISDDVPGDRTGRDRVDGLLA